MITLPILILAIVLFAWKEAVDDDGAIDKTNADGTKFSHYDPDRYIVAGVFTLIMAGFAQTWWALLYFPITWAVFTISFRWILNRKRGMDWRYISPSNMYDSFFMGLSWRMSYSTWPTRTNLARWHKDLYDESWTGHSKFMASMHRAGAFAYSFEATILLASLTIYITKTL